MIVENQPPWAPHLRSKSRLRNSQKLHFVDPSLAVAALRADPDRLLVEHPFGTMQRGMDQGHFLLKGLTKVWGEFSLTVLAYNLKRVLKIVGVPGLLAALA